MDHNRQGGWMKARYDTYCGLNCGACAVLVANERADEEWIKKAAEMEKCKPEDLRCMGCKTDVTAVFCADCGMRLCAREKGVEFCFECDSYPCKTISDFRSDDLPHHSVVFKNLKDIKEKGLEAWLAEQTTRWSCQTCGTRFTWYDENCKGCGTKLYNCKDEDKDLVGA
ncbi:hypothetical protein CEE36_01305 [candidate division TA06 bacterium B3_TA06]|uniref:DUF3795 domain-containing protein n=1 Tax=candidate division TA06 bacterium B3_TA06 TaxID=2012487 RepID=A0A532VBQ7_UNCT6|nr:MAG: hypothetical protein CEE36_01305 [candidate division TA06 bacterium B3_TA06]